ncbi:MAG: hypothetical protein QOH15_2524 [Gaiellales bacterium]|nr:hypothetical protein [Gaiellales bacterium]
MQEIAPRLRPWTAWHDHWEEDVAALAQRWLGKGTHADLRKSLLPLLDLPVERVLVSHGAPILSGGKQALADALH